MEHKTFNRFVAGGVFLASLATYVITLSPTVVFWDAGEFCAAAYALQVPHSPGSPLFLLLAHLASMVPFVPDIAMRMHFVSGFAGALTCTFLYLLSVRFIVMWRGLPATSYDRMVVYGSAVVGSLSLAFSPTFWSNAVEAEVYCFSMLFVSGIIWLGTCWYERADDTRGDAYLLLIAYILGLAVGVHFMSILALFPVMLFYYFRVHEFSIVSFVKFGIVALIVFGIVYPGIVKVLPSLLDGEFGGYRNQFIALIPLLLIGAVAYGVMQSIKTRNRFLNIAFMSFLLIVLGYSTYTLIFIRANSMTPMNVNDPSNLPRFVSYINRDQYGDEPMMNRRWSDQPAQRAAAAKYTSDFDYFWRYQLVHMYLRYVGWNYVGSEGDWKDAGVNWKQLYGIPLFLGLLGAFHHWRKDPRMAAVASATFVVMGLALVLNRNFQEPEFRERDYFFIGSFFMFSMWIGMGTIGLIDWFKEKYRSAGRFPLTGYGLLILAFVFVPVNMLRTNFHQANRKGNYFAWDYSYNVLQSCDQDAILFTNGDNDTYPLWYLQQVEGIRRDVRVVTVGLLSMNWYVRQLKHSQPYGAKKVPISTPDGEIDNLSPREFQPRVVRLPVPAEVMKRYGLERSAVSVTTKDKGNPLPDTISFTMQNTLQYGNTKAIRAQDLMVLDIIASSNWERPIYFAMTVPPEGQIGLKDYLQLEGLAYRLTPKKATSLWSNIDETRMRSQLFTDVESTSKTPAMGCRWRGLQDSTTYFDEEIRHLMSNYRQAFVLLARHYVDTPGMAWKSAESLDRMEQVIPRQVIEMDYRTKLYVASLYNAGGKKDKCDQISTEIVTALKPLVERGVAGPLTNDNPYVLLLQTYETMGQFDDALKLIDVIRVMYSHEKDIDLIVGQTRAALMAERAAAHQRDSLAAATSAKGK